MSKKYRFLEYMADALIEAWGDSLEEAFANAALAFYDTMVEADRIEPRQPREVEVEGTDLYELLYNWIEELIYIFETEGLVCSKFDIKISGGDGLWRLRGRIYGEPYSKEKHGSKTHIKAVTYHEMKIEVGREGARVRYLLDL